ncbi:MAG: bifunctional methylenetetrahydrofolate dehydrogenase/methenyltetrahydrofolate cyclohydrolase [Candidatus Jacksonbacteria bacterium]|nr:bifunctional methylenetetrahydrofolate dehydrogenase/methenyltetrahydrofolate cyclohydrolase [Candidatus Jacksonbacteria bacterium]
MAIIINGKKIARAITKKLTNSIKDSRAEPGLAAILIGENEASKIYINEKRKTAKKIGIAFRLFAFPDDASEELILQRIQILNQEKNIHGIIVQFPIPRSFSADKIIDAISPTKDADGFHPKNIAKFLRLRSLENVLEKRILVPVTPVAIMEIINYVKLHNPYPDSLKKIVLVGKCSVFIAPLIRYFELNGNRAFAVISPHEPKLWEKTREADILISAVGRPSLISEKMARNGAVVIDVGTSRVRGRIVGDVDFENVRTKASFITPPTGGVGPVTVAILLRNVVYAAMQL